MRCAQRRREIIVEKILMTAAQKQKMDVQDKVVEDSGIIQFQLKMTKSLVQQFPDLTAETFVLKDLFVFFREGTVMNARIVALSASVKVSSSCSCSRPQIVSTKRVKSGEVEIGSASASVSLPSLG